MVYIDHLLYFYSISFNNSDLSESILLISSISLMISLVVYLIKVLLNSGCRADIPNSGASISPTRSSSIARGADYFFTQTAY